MSAIPGLAWDACTLLNLLATRQETQILSALECPSYVVAEVRQGEVLSLRPLPEEDPQGRLMTADTTSLLHSGRLVEVSLAADELALFVEFASQMDDGESRSAAIAVRLGLHLVTDDRVSLRIAHAHLPAIPTITTPDFVKHWADQASVDRHTLAEALRRIEICATYRPRRLHPLRAWWDQHRPTG
jgi:D-alanyl-D-alanine dipeptidase